MAISVWFRGPMLFTRKKVGGKLVLRDVLLPAAPIRDRFAGDLGDNPNCVPHLAGLVRETGSSWSLENYNAAFTCAAGGETAAGGISELISLSSLLKGAKPPELMPVSAGSTNVKSAITFSGGTLSFEGSSDMLYNFPCTAFSPKLKERKIPLFVKWTASDAVTLRLTPRFEGMPAIDVSLARCGDVFVYNFESERPATRDAFMRGPAKGEPHATKRRIDQDFKWLYWCLTGRGLDWVTWRDGHDLPAPEYYRDEPVARGLSAENGDCFCAVWDL